MKEHRPNKYTHTIFQEALYKCSGGIGGIFSINEASVGQ